MARGPLGRASRPRLGQPVLDRSGAVVGRIDEICRGRPLAVADDGRSIGEAGDLIALLPGRYRRRLPFLTPAVAARLVREGYLRTHMWPGGRPVRYIANSEIDGIIDDVVRLRVDVADLPSVV